MDLGLFYVETNPHVWGMPGVVNVATLKWLHLGMRPKKKKKKNMHLSYFSSRMLLFYLLGILYSGGISHVYEHIPSDNQHWLAGKCHI